MRIVVTAGPTREPIDPVRFISNRSSGKMGYALAEAALEQGNEVTLISGPTALACPEGAEFVAVITSDELFDAVHTQVRSCDALIMCAAVSDYKPRQVAARKAEKQPGPFTLELAATRDILASLPNERSYTVVGFAAQTHELEANARRKLVAKNCDMIVANDVSRAETGMESDENEVSIFFRDAAPHVIARAPKIVIAREIVKIVSLFHQKSLTKKT